MPTCPTVTQPGNQAVIRPGHWPLRASLPLGPVLTAAGCARAWASEVLWEWKLTGLAETVTLIVSELVTNAVAASRAMDGGPFPVRLWMFSDRMRGLVVVWDACPNPPMRLDPADDVEDGRGLMLVAALSAEWGWHPAEWDRLEGKATWALISPEE
jgi:anti-sigma regulatory factor (Ser/Thr protein kinase)